MKSDTNKRAVSSPLVLIPVCLALALFPVLNLGAQTPLPLSIGDLYLPGVPSAYTPQSGTAMATMGTIGTDADRFMSVFDFGGVQYEQYFFTGGFSESITEGLNAGFAARFGKVFFGVAYGGSLIGDLVTLIPNQKLINNTPSNNTLSVLVGSGIFGIKAGFSEFLQIIDQNGEDIRELGLKPSLELGFNLRAGPVLIKPAIRGAFDIHKYRSTMTNGDTKTQKLLDFSEPSAGITLAVDFGGSEHTRMELDLNADAALRLYDNNGKSGVSSTWTAPGGTTVYEASGMGDLRITGSPAFIFRRDFNRRFTLGAKATAIFGYDTVRFSQTRVSDGQAKYSVKETTLSITPDLGVGARFNLLPDHFVVHGGLGIPVLSYSQTQTKTGGSVDPDPVTKTEWVPSVRFAVGMAVNFTQNTALDLLASASVSGLDTANTAKFTVLFTVKK